MVLTDYAVLRAESNYSTPLNYRFRRKKRYEIPNTPLLQIRWWRLILDEEQQIESRVSQSARMALKLSTKYRWAVTGTPIGKNGLDDLYGLVKFLGVEPFNTQVAWLRTVAEPYYNGDDRRLLAILKRIMWRQAKHHVADELVLSLYTAMIAIRFHILSVDCIENKIHRIYHRAQKSILN